MAIYSNLTVDQGSTFSVAIDVTDSSGDALNLTGYGVAGQIRKTYSSTTFTPFTASVYNQVGGVVKIELSAATTNLMKPGRYVYDVEISRTINATDEVTRIVEGQLEVRPGVTKAT
jgi:hypothetical protein|tara:strand:- start:673 stop:1020 length:348 start_codon:yes stop_codon:yes gene_type:complete